MYFANITDNAEIIFMFALNLVLNFRVAQLPHFITHITSQIVPQLSSNLFTFSRIHDIIIKNPTEALYEQGMESGYSLHGL